MTANARKMYAEARMMAVFLIGLLVPMSAAPAVAQSTGAERKRPLTERLAQAFETGNAQLLLASAADRLAVSLFGAAESYSRGQALYVMKNFFQENPPRRFVLQRVREMEGHRFAMGRYWREGSQQPLTVYLRLRSGEDGWVLREIRIGGGSP